MTRTRSTLLASTAAFLLAEFIIPQPTSAQVAPSASASHVGSNSIGGVVTSAKGPEAGVWVIAETNDLPTKYAKIVVTDDEGRYLLPDLPAATYTLWVRGYGLVDSQQTRARPGALADLAASVAPERRIRQRRFIQRSTGIRCSRSRTRACSPARPATRICQTA